MDQENQKPPEAQQENNSFLNSFLDGLLQSGSVDESQVLISNSTLEKSLQDAVVVEQSVTIQPSQSIESSSVESTLSQPTNSKSIYQKMVEEYSWDYKNRNDVEKIVYTLIRQVQELKEDIVKIRNDKVIDELKLPPEIIDKLVIPSKVRRIKRGLGARPITEREIDEAFAHAKSKADAARYLGVSPVTLRKYADRYGKWKTFKTRGNESVPRGVETGKYPLSEILMNKHPDCPANIIKCKLIVSGVKMNRCEQCFYCEKRITDGRIPLLLNFDDGNTKNHKLENLKILCYNCTFMLGRGFVRRGRNNGFEFPASKLDPRTKKVSSPKSTS